jgi:beta-glucanase (GH16 family)
MIVLYVSTQRIGFLETTPSLTIWRYFGLRISSSVQVRGLRLTIRKESLGVRDFSAASLTSCDRYLFGRFEAMIKASKVPGVVTGFFLHRDSPRQEIDIEIAGNRTDRLLVNVFYNPGDEGAKYDYGYRGAPSYIDLGFDASESYHLIQN